LFVIEANSAGIEVAGPMAVAVKRKGVELVIEEAEALLELVKGLIVKSLKYGKTLNILESMASSLRVLS
jgi:hypothetical protein